jgi:hypothetical protein
LQAMPRKTSASTKLGHDVAVQLLAAASGDLMKVIGAPSDPRRLSAPQTASCSHQLASTLRCATTTREQAKIIFASSRVIVTFF